MVNMITSQRQLEGVLRHLELESTKRAAIRSAVENGITHKPKYVRIAVDELAKAKRFGKAAGFASKINDEALARDLLAKQYRANIAEVRLKEQNLRKFEDLLSRLDSPEEMRHAIISAVERGVTHKLDHVRIAIAHYELIGPGAFKDAQKAAKSVGAVTSQICESEGWLGLAAYLSEGEGDIDRTRSMYSSYIQMLEDVGRFGIAAELSLHKLNDAERAMADGKKAGMWEIVAELYRRIGDEKLANLYGSLASMLR